MTKEEVLCPRCEKRPLELPLERNALSRDDNETYICSPCGTAEAMDELSRYTDTKAKAD